MEFCGNPEEDSEGSDEASSVVHRGRGMRRDEVIYPENEFALERASFVEF